MVLRSGERSAFWVESQTRVQENRAMRILLMGWRLMKNRERAEREGMPESGLVFAFANGKCFVCWQVRD